MKSLISSRLVAVVVILLAAVPWAVSGAPPVQVSAAEPSSAPQGTLSLDVAVSGSGFDSSAAVDFFVTGTVNPGGVTVKQVTVVGSKKLIARIDVADAAAIDSFDIQVRLSGGRKGKGTSLFRVLAKTSADACTNAVGFPSFVFRKSSGQVGTYVTDSTGQCTQLLGNFPSISTRFSYPVKDDLGNSTNKGRLVWFGRDPADTSSGAKLQYHAMDFVVNGTTVTNGPVHMIVDFGAMATEGGGNNGICCGLDLTVDGRELYLPIKAELRPEGYVNAVVLMRLPANLAELDPAHPPAQTVVFEHSASSRNDTEYTTDLDVNAMNDFLYVRQSYGGYTGSRVLRVDLDPDLTDTGSSPEVVVLVEPTWASGVWVGADVSSPASDLLAVAYSPDVGDCPRLTIMNGRTGTILNEGTDWPARWVSWMNGKLLAAGFRKGCRELDSIVAIDPLSGQSTILTTGGLPDGR